MSKRLLIAFVIVDVLLGFAVYRGYQSWSQRDTFREAADAQQAANAEMRELGTTEFPEPRDLVGFTLQDQNAEPFSNQHLRGKWSLVFFGFTHCPDICPLTMTELAQFYAQLSAAEQAQVRVILGTVDPERDDPAAMAAYVGKYNDDFVGLTGSRVALSVLTKQLFVTYSDPAELINHEDHERAPHQPMTQAATAQSGGAMAMPGGDHSEHSEQAELGDDYLITHSGHIALINPAGQFHGVIRPPHRDADILAVVRKLLTDPAN